MTGETIPTAVKVLEKGGLVVFPTETCYGLGADATNPEAVRRLFEVKHRPLDKAISVIVDSLDMIKEYAYVSREAEKLAEEHMPGPLTLIVKNKSFNSLITGGELKVGFRIPDHVIALELVKRFGKPITATSANISGAPDPYEPPSLPGVDFIINWGRLPRKVPSTVYDTLLKKTLRQGPIKL